MIPIIWLDAGMMTSGIAVILWCAYLLLRWREISEVQMPFLSKRPALAWAKMGIWTGMIGSICMVASTLDPAHRAFNHVPLMWAIGLMARTAALFALFVSIDSLLHERKSTNADR